MTDIQIIQPQMQQQFNNTVTASQLVDQFINNLRVGQNLTAEVVFDEKKFWLVVEGNRLLLSKATVEQLNLQDNQLIKLKVISLAEPVELQIIKKNINNTQPLNTPVATKPNLAIYNRLTPEVTITTIEQDIDYLKPITKNVIVKDMNTNKESPLLQTLVKIDKTDATPLDANISKLINKNVIPFVLTPNMSSNKATNNNHLLNTTKSQPFFKESALTNPIKIAEGIIKIEGLGSNKVSDSIENLISASKSVIPKDVLPQAPSNKLVLPSSGGIITIESESVKNQLIEKLQIKPGQTIPLSEPTVIKAQASTVKSEPIIINTQASTVKSEPIIINTQASALKSEPIIINTQASALKSEPTVMNALASTLKSEPTVMNALASTLKSEPTVINTQASTLKSEPTVINTQASTLKSEQVVGKTVKFDIPINLPDEGRFPLLSEKILAAYNRLTQTQPSPNKSMNELFTLLHRLNKWSADSKMSGHSTKGYPSEKLASDLKQSLKDLFRYVGDKDSMKTGTSVERAIKQSGTFLEKRSHIQHNEQKQYQSKSAPELTLHKDIKANLNRVLVTAIYNLAKINTTPTSNISPTPPNQGLKTVNVATTNMQSVSSLATFQKNQIETSDILNNDLLNNIRAQLKKYTAGKSSSNNLPELESITKEVLKNAQSALSRTQLNQLTNLRPETSVQQWLFELPVLNNNRIDVFSIFLKEDTDAEKKLANQRSWSIVLQFDIGSLGKMRTMVSWNRNKIKVRFLAEQHDTVALVDSELSHFQKILTEQGISFEQLTVEQALLDDVRVQFSQSTNNER